MRTLVTCGLTAAFVRLTAGAFAAGPVPPAAVVPEVVPPALVASALAGARESAPRPASIAVTASAASWLRRNLSVRVRELRVANRFPFPTGDLWFGVARRPTLATMHCQTGKRYRSCVSPSGSRPARDSA